MSRMTDVMEELSRLGAVRAPKPPAVQAEAQTPVEPEVQAPESAVEEPQTDDEVAALEAALTSGFREPLLDEEDAGEEADVETPARPSRPARSDLEAPTAEGSNLSAMLMAAKSRLALIERTTEELRELLDAVETLSRRRN